MANKIPVKNRVLVEQVNSAEHASANGGTKPLLGVAAALLVLLGGAGLVLALDRLIPRRKPSAARARHRAPRPRELKRRSAVAPEPRRSLRRRPSCPRSRCRR